MLRKKLIIHLTIALLVFGGDRAMATAGPPLASTLSDQAENIEKGVIYLLQFIEYNSAAAKKAREEYRSASHARHLQGVAQTKAVAESTLQTAKDAKAILVQVQAAFNAAQAATKKSEENLKDAQGA